jgi:hypothetical protein
VAEQLVQTLDALSADGAWLETVAE